MGVAKRGRANHYISYVNSFDRILDSITKIIKLLTDSQSIFTMQIYGIGDVPELNLTCLASSHHIIYSLYTSVL